jgi:hypothetical protein
MRKGFGGKQRVIQFGGLLSVGEGQNMHFVPSDAGSYWMTDAEKHSNGNDSPSGKKIKRFRNNEGDLLKVLQ